MRKFLPSGALWAHAGFLRLWAAQTVSSFGARIAREGFAMTAILTIHAPASQLGLLAALSRGPGVVVGLVAGGFVDRGERRRLMIVCDIARAFFIFAIPIAAWLHQLHMPLIFIMAGLVGAANALFEIADRAFLPVLIDREHLMDGNSKLGVTDAVAEIGGPAMAGTLFQLLTAPFAMLATALTYLISAFFLFSIQARELPPESKHESQRWYRDIGSGFAAILAQPFLRPILWMAIVSNLFGSFFWPLYLVYGLKTLGMSPSLMGCEYRDGRDWRVIRGVSCEYAFQTLRLRTDTSGLQRCERAPFVARPVGARTTLVVDYDADDGAVWR